MTVTVKPGTARGVVTAPPSKSAAHRVLIAGALSAGSRVQNLADSQDILATRTVLEQMGATLREEDGGLFVGGLNPFSTAALPPLPCRESGSTLRFFIPLCLLSQSPRTLSGSERLMARPLTAFETLCGERGLRFERSRDTVTVCGPLAGGDFRVENRLSSQFVTGLLMALPLLPQDSRLVLESAPASRSYIDLTLHTLARFGVCVTQTEETAFHIPGRQTYRPSTVTVEGDYSNAAFWEALNTLGGQVTVRGLAADSVQGDRVYADDFDRLRRGDSAPLDLTDCPDLAPILFAVAAMCGGGRFIGTDRLHYKESDRVEAMRAELAKCGVTLREGADTVTVEPARPHTPTVPLCGHNDHRIVMALAVLCTRIGGTIEGAEAVSKSYPDFFTVLQSLGIQVNAE